MRFYLFMCFNFFIFSMMTHGSLFSGIGGFDLAAEWMGWENLFHCEFDEWNRKILNYYWPKSKSYENIKTTNFIRWRGKIDILTGGFPCQPFSNAGKRKGTDDERHLWPEMLRAIREIQPRFVVGENVRGLVNWSDGLVFEQVCSDLENEGFKVITFILPACAVNAPHRRDRIWFVAYADENITNNDERKNNGTEKKIWRNETRHVFGELCRFGFVADADKTNADSQKPTNKRRPNDKQKRRRLFDKFGGICTFWNVDRINGTKNNNFQKFPTQSPICGGDDGIPTELDNLTIPKWRKQSLMAYGNAIVPQVAFRIFQSINEYEKNRKTNST